MKKIPYDLQTYSVPNAKSSFLILCFDNCINTEP